MLSEASGSRVSVSCPVIYGCQVGLELTRGFLPPARSLSAQQSAPCSVGWGAGDSCDSGGHGQAAPHPLGHRQEHTQGQSLGSLLGHHPSLAFLGLFLPHQGSLCLSQQSKPHTDQRSTLAPGCISRHRPRMASFLPALSPGRDTGQVLLYLAPRQRAPVRPSAPLGLWPGPSRGKGLYFGALSRGRQVVRTGVSGCRGSEHEFCFGLHWACSLPKGSESGSCCFFYRLFFCE